LTIDGKPIKIVKETKFLGLIFDNKLSFIQHINYLRSRCLKALDIIKVLANTQWGADSTVLLQLYRTLIRSKLDYGCIVYGSARKSYLLRLDTIHHQGIRLALGAFRTSPIQSLYIEGHEPSLRSRRLKLALQYIIKLKGNILNPAYKCIFTPGYKRLYEARPTYVRPLSLRMKSHLEALHTNLHNIALVHWSDIPPWQLRKPNIILQLAMSRKSETHPLSYHERFADVRSAFPSHRAIYTDGSKTQNRVSAAAVVHGRELGIRIPDQSSIFTAEARALLLALECIETSRKHKFIIFTDSFSCLRALSNRKLDHPLIQQFLIKLTSLTIAKYDIHLCWVPSHVGIPGNERADQAATRALSAPWNNVKYLTPI
jgi:ribonuclease HI